MKISFPQATLGDEIEIDTLDGKYKLRIPAATQNGKKFRLTNSGIPYLGNDAKRGDHVVTVIVEVPTKISAEEKEILKKYADERGESYDEEGVIDKVKRKMGL